MASKRHLRRRACERKVAHRSASAAYGAVRGHLATYGELLSYYRCRWHLAHDEDNHDNRKLKAG